MNTQSLYGDLAINLLCGQVETTQPHTQLATYGRNSARRKHNGHSLPGTTDTTHSGGRQYIQKPITNTSADSRKTERIPNQNTPQKTCTDLAAECHFASFSKNVFRCRPTPKFGGYQTGIFTPPKLESGTKNDKSVHGHFFKMPFRQDDQFFYRTGSVGKCTSRDFWVCKQLLLTQLIISNSITKFDYLVQG